MALLTKTGAPDLKTKKIKLWCVQCQERTDHKVSVKTSDNGIGGTFIRWTFTCTVCGHTFYDSMNLAEPYDGE